jgi:hypothetical protein
MSSAMSFSFGTKCPVMKGGLANVATAEKPGSSEETKSNHEDEVSPVQEGTECDVS